MLVRHVLKSPFNAANEDASDAEFAVPSDSLGVFTGDEDSDVLKNPRAFAFNAEDKQIKPLTADDATVALNTNNVTVTLPAAATEDTDIWVLIQAQATGLPKSQVASGKILMTDLNKTTKVLTIRAVTSGQTYSMLTLVTGLLPTAFDDIP